MGRKLLQSLALATALAGTSPLASAEPLAVLHPVERPAYSDDWRAATSRSARPGDRLFVILRVSGAPCAPISARGAAVAFWQMLPLTTTMPSGEDTPTGTFHEVLVPRTAASCTASDLVLAEWTAETSGIIVLRQAGHEVLVRQRILPERRRPALPFLVGMNPANLPRGHCPDGDCPDSAELLARYATLLVEHGLQPMQTFVRFPPIRDGMLDLDAGSDSGTSFRQTVMAPAVHGRIGFPRATRYPDRVAYLRALQRTVVAEGLVGQAWVYAADEPTDIDALAAQLELYRRHAPDVRVMVTTGRDRRLDGLVDTYAPVFNRLVSRRHPGPRDYPDHELWTYLSCMGSCGPNLADKAGALRDPGPETGLADLLIDRPAARLFRFFATVSGRVDGLIYYEATETYRLVPQGTDILADTWNFGGNGDGLLVFPGRPGMYGLDAHRPLPSLRLKLLRHALQKAWARTQ